MPVTWKHVRVCMYINIFIFIKYINNSTSIYYLSNIALLDSWTWICPFLCNVLVVYPVCFHSCLRGIAIQENKPTSKTTLDVYFIFKTRQKKRLSFCCLLSVFFYLFRVKCYYFTKQTISLTWLSKTNGFSWTLIGNIAGKRIPTSKWPIVRDIYLFPCSIV